jgi:hypothetical protein
MSDTDGHKGNISKQGLNNNREKSEKCNTMIARKDLRTLKPKSFGTIRMVSSRTYNSDKEESGE